MQIIHISSFHERSNLENKTKDKLLSMVFIDPIYFMNSLFNFASFHSTFQPKVVEILIELINKSYHDQNLPVVRNVKVFFRKCENLKRWKMWKFSSISLIALPSSHLHISLYELPRGHPWIIIWYKNKNIFSQIISEMFLNINKEIIRGKSWS